MSIISHDLRSANAIAPEAGQNMKLCAESSVYSSSSSWACLTGCQIRPLLHRTIGKRQRRRLSPRGVGGGSGVVPTVCHLGRPTVGVVGGGHEPVF
jgi:hypothetical protein